MTTLRTIVTDALRESGNIQVGTDPESAEFEEGLRRLQNIIRSLLGQECGENLQDVTFGVTSSSHNSDDWNNLIRTRYIPSNHRVVFSNTQAETLYLDPRPRDGARIAVIDNSGNFATYNLTLDGNGRKIESSATVTLSTDSLVREWMYRADLGSWNRITDLTANDDNPYPAEFDDFLILMLAIRLNPRYGTETAGETSSMLNRYRSQFRSRYRQNVEMPSEEALARTHPHYNVFDKGDSNDIFSIG